MASARAGDLTLYAKLWAQVRPCAPRILVCLLLGLLSVPLALLTPVPLKIAVDSVIGSDPLPALLEKLLPAAIRQSGLSLLAFAAALVIAVALLNRALGLATSLLRAHTAEKLVLDFRARLFAHAQRLSLSYHETRGTADAVYRVQYDALSIQHVAVEGVISAVTAGLTVIGLIYVSARIDWELAVIGLSVSPVLFLVMRIYRRHLRSQSREVSRLESRVASMAQEVLSTLRVVKAFGREDHESQRFLRGCEERRSARIRLARLEGAYGVLAGAIPALGTAIVLFVGIYHVQSRILTLGELLLVMSYLTQLTEPLKTLSRRAASLQLHLAAAERAFALLDKPQDVSQRPDARPLPRALGAVACRNVSFGYDPHRLVLRDISFEVRAGSRVGILGDTGAGKTTLIGLMMRFYDPTLGRIELDGVDMREYRVADLRHNFAMVLQEPVLFSTTIAQNIAYARPEAARDDIFAAAKSANAHDFISALPKGYETQVGERGLRLSGGERQRISLARAFLKDAPILILDEPTSSVDEGTEAVILEAMERLMLGRTTFLISHRQSVFRDCDVLLQMEHGRLVAETQPTLRSDGGPDVARRNGASPRSRAYG